VAAHEGEDERVAAGELASEGFEAGGTGGGDDCVLVLDCGREGGFIEEGAFDNLFL
jgi:pyridoxal biosynthesis lyase PdxS